VCSRCSHTYTHIHALAHAAATLTYTYTPSHHTPTMDPTQTKITYKSAHAAATLTHTYTPTHHTHTIDPIPTQKTYKSAHAAATHTRSPHKKCVHIAGVLRPWGGRDILYTHCRSGPVSFLRRARTVRMGFAAALTPPLLCVWHGPFICGT